MRCPSDEGAEFNKKARRLGAGGRLFETAARALAGEPLRRRVALLDRDRVPRLGRGGVLDEGDRRTGPDRELAHQPVVRPGVAEDPPAAVHVDDDGQDRRRAAGPDDPHPDVTDRRGHGDPLLVDGQLVDGRRLEVVEHLARSLRTQVDQTPWGRPCLGEVLRGRFEDDPLLDGGHAAPPGAAAVGSARNASSSRLTSAAWVTQWMWGPPSIST